MFDIKLFISLLTDKILDLITVMKMNVFIAEIVSTEVARQGASSRLSACVYEAGN